jgi:hypothetical protein
MLSRNTSVVDYMFGWREMTPPDLWGYAINLPGTMRPSLGPDIPRSEAKKSCFHVWRVDTDEPGWAMNIHLDGTYSQASYDISSGAEAVWRTTYYVPAEPYMTFIYDPPESNVCGYHESKLREKTANRARNQKLTIIKDEFRVQGPFKQDNFRSEMSRTVSGPTGPVKLACGTGIVGILSELSIEAPSNPALGHTGKIMGITGAAGGEDPWGRMLSHVTYNWARCESAVRPTQPAGT